jgi:hypothetical protein
LWNMREALHLTLRSFNNLRNPDEATPPSNSKLEVVTPPPSALRCVAGVVVGVCRRGGWRGWVGGVALL